MLITILLGIASSIAAELVTWLNKKLSGTVIKGQGAFLFSLSIAFVIATGTVLVRNFNVDLSGFLALATSIFGISQVWFYIIAKNLGLTVEPTLPTLPTALPLL